MALVACVLLAARVVEQVLLTAQVQMEFQMWLQNLEDQSWLSR